MRKDTVWLGAQAEGFSAAGFQFQGRKWLEQIGPRALIGQAAPHGRASPLRCWSSGQGAPAGIRHLLRERIDALGDERKGLVAAEEQHRGFAEARSGDLCCGYTSWTIRPLPVGVCAFALPNGELVIFSNGSGDEPTPSTKNEGPPHGLQLRRHPASTRPLSQDLSIWHNFWVCATRTNST
jgi:hypothetical protein